MPLCVGVQVPPSPFLFSGVSKWSKEGDCKSSASCFAGSNPAPPKIRSVRRFQKNVFYFIYYLEHCYFNLKL
jgi:hypothetical protein